MEHITVALTNDHDMGTLEKLQFQALTTESVIAYLEADPRHAVVVRGTEENVAVWRGASEELDNFYYQPLPLIEPDAEGGDWTAGEALSEVIVGY